MVQWLLENCSGLAAKLLQWPNDARHPIALARVMQHSTVTALLAHAMSYEALGPMLSASDDAVMIGTLPLLTPSPHSP